METTAPQDSIVVGVDGSDSAAKALTWAADEAARLGRPIHLIHAFAPDYPSLDFGRGFNTEMLRESAEAVLQGAIERVHAVDRDIPITTATTRGYASGALVRASHRANKVVLGVRGLGLLGSAALGSVSLQVAAHAHCPVVVVRRGGAGRLHHPRIVAGYDGSTRSMQAVEFAFDRAELYDGELLVVHTWWPADVDAAERARHQDWESYQRREEARVAENLAGLCDRHPEVKVMQHVIQGHPGKALVKEAEDADMLVVGNRGAGGFAGLNLGSVSHAVLRLAPCPVAIVRGVDGGQGT